MKILWMIKTIFNIITIIILCAILVKITVPVTKCNRNIIITNIIHNYN